MPKKLININSHCRARTFFFRIRVLNVWNDLPADTVGFRSLQSFKKTISTVVGCVAQWQKAGL